MEVSCPTPQTTGRTVKRRVGWRGGNSRPLGSKRAPVGAEWSLQASLSLVLPPRLCFVIGWVQRQRQLISAKPVLEDRCSPSSFPFDGRRSSGASIILQGRLPPGTLYLYCPRQRQSRQESTSPIHSCPRISSSPPVFTRTFLLFDPRCNSLSDGLTAHQSKNYQQPPGQHRV